MHRSLLAIVVVAGCALAVQGQIIGHSEIDAVGSLPQTTMDAIGQQTWLFTHASVGGNMMSGMSSLHAANPTRYHLVAATVGGSGSRADAPPGATTAGTIYDCSRGNPGWQGKVTFLDNSVRVGGWHDPAVTVVLDKMCYIDQNADAGVYLQSMTALEASYPGTKFVYMTMPLTTSTDSANVLRNDYNAAVRSFCSANGKLLFDIADMEAHDAAGVEYTFASGGHAYQKMYTGYSSDGGHLNAAGSERIALGWYATAAALAVPGSVGSTTPGDSTTPDGSSDTGDTSSDSNPTPVRGLCGFGAAGAVLMMMLGLIGMGMRTRSRRDILSERRDLTGGYCREE